MSELFMEMHQRRARSRSSNLSRSDRQRNPKDNEDDENNNTNNFDEDEDPLANVLSLKLKKPKGWKWELSTSRSCSNIALPHILLYDDAGELLVDTEGQPEGVFRQDDYEKPMKTTTKVTPKATTTAPMTTTPSRSSSARKHKKAAGRSATTNLESAVRQALDREFDGLCIQEATPSPTTSRCSSRPRHSPAAIDVFTHELPDYAFQRRANSFKGVRFQVDENEDEFGNEIENSNEGSFHVVDLPTPPSTVTTTSSSGPREKRRYRRSQSSLARSPATSESILERFSLSRGRFSSPEFAEEQQLPQHGPRYFLRTSKAGTLVVHEESFSRCRRRRRPRHSSSENILNDSSSKSRSTGSLKTSGATSTTANHRLRLGEERGSGGGSLQNVVEQRPRRRALPVRRYRSDANVLLLHQARSASSSSSEAEGGGGTPGRPLRKYGDYRRQSKRGLVPIDPENGTWRSQERPTAR